MRPSLEFAPWKQSFIIIIWLGMATGLTEGFLFLLLQEMGWLTWARQVRPVDVNILWASTLVNTLGFGILGLFWVLPLKAFPRLPWNALTTGAFGSLASFLLLLVSGHLRESGAAMLGIGLGVAAARMIVANPKAQVSFFRKSLLPLALAAALVCGASYAWQRVWEAIQVAQLPAPPQKAPNILLIVLDTLRADRIGAYGYSRPTTPFLDRLAKESVLFEAAFANSSWTLPSHASMFTGRLPSEHGAVLLPEELPFPTIAEVLASKGYATAGFASNNGVLSNAFGLAKGFQRWDNMFFSFFDSASRTMLVRRFRRYLLRGLAIHPHLDHMGAPEIEDGFLKWLDNRPPRPFFAFLNYMETHARYTPPHEYAKRFSSQPERITPPGDPLFFSEWKFQGQEDKRQLMNDAYDAVLAYLDAQLEHLFAELARRGLDQNLILIITSDHGESLGERGLYDHRNSLYLEQIRVPLVIRAPGRTPPGARVASAVGLRRLPVTILDLAGLQNDVFPTRSLAELWSRREYPSETSAIAELSGDSWPGVDKRWPIHQGWVKSLVRGQWHLLLQENGKVELFNWKEDPLEVDNLAEDPAHKSVAGELGAALEAATSLSKRD